VIIVPAKDYPSAGFLDKNDQAELLRIMQKLSAKLRRDSDLP